MITGNLSLTEAALRDELVAQILVNQGAPKSLARRLGPLPSRHRWDQFGGLEGTSYGALLALATCAVASSGFFESTRSGARRVALVSSVDALEPVPFKTKVFGLGRVYPVSIVGSVAVAVAGVWMLALSISYLPGGLYGPVVVFALGAGGVFLGNYYLQSSARGFAIFLARRLPKSRRQRSIRSLDLRPCKAGRINFSCATVIGAVLWLGGEPVVFSSDIAADEGWLTDGIRIVLNRRGRPCWVPYDDDDDAPRYAPLFLPALLQAVLTMPYVDHLEFRDDVRVEICHYRWNTVRPWKAPLVSRPDCASLTEAGPRHGPGRGV